jgi:tetratricopeptide (TPR) repeat protein
MLKEFISQILMVISAAAVLFLLGRKVSGVMKKIDKRELEKNTESSQTPSPEKMKEYIFRKLEKILRRIKIFFLQSDAKIVAIIKRLRKGREEKFPEEENVSQKKPLENLENRDEKKKKFILDKVSIIKKKLASSKNIVKISSLKKEKVPDSLKPQIPSPESINIEEAKRVMLERREKSLIRQIALNPRNDKAYVELGKLYRDAKNLKDSRASFKQALKINKGNVNAKKLLKELEG